MKMLKCSRSEMTAKARPGGMGEGMRVVPLMRPPTGRPDGAVRKIDVSLWSWAIVSLSFPCASAHSTPNDRSLLSVTSAIVTSSSTWRGTTSIFFSTSAMSW